MIDMLKRHEIQVLRRAEHTWSEIAALSGISEKTARRIAAEDSITSVDNEAERARRQVGRPSKAEAYRDVLVQALTEDPSLRSVELLHRARQAGYTGGKSAVYALAQQTRLARLTRRAHFPFLKKKRPRRRVTATSPRPLPPTAINHVWAYDFVFDTCADGRSLKCLTVIDEFTRECLAIDVAGGIRSGRVIEVLTQLVSLHGAPRYLRSDNGLPQKSSGQGFSVLA
jgi:transposase InsO family protein